VVIASAFLIIIFKNNKAGSGKTESARHDIKAAIGPEPASLDPAINIETR